MIEKRTISAIAMFLLPGEIKASAPRDMIEAVILLVSDNDRDQIAMSNIRPEISWLKYFTRHASLL